MCSSDLETPILQTIQGGATAKPFITHFNALDQECYLRIATELHLKRCIVGGFERVFEIGRIFRNEGMDLTHNPEFTPMEAYRAFSDLEGMKELAEGVIKAAAHAVGLEGVIEYQGQQIDLFSNWESRPMTSIVSDVLGREVTLDTPVEELRAACAEDFVRGLPGGLDCPLRERGGSLSEGQNQRLAIARAILADAPILLLDEVTSALDLETEQRVLENIAALPGKTCILSTHRPSVLSLCSRVYRLHNAALELLPESEWRRLYRNN